MPYLGRTSFLHPNKIQKIEELDVSMPYLGRTSFLRVKSVLYDDLVYVVSMPYLGRTSFLR